MVLSEDRKPDINMGVGMMVQLFKVTRDVAMTFVYATLVTGLRIVLIYVVPLCG